MKARGDNVVVRKVHEEVKRNSGLITTEYTDKNIRHKKAEVVAVGDAVKGLSEGDMVYYDFAAGSDIRIQGESLIVVPDRHVAIKE